MAASPKHGESHQAEHSTKGRAHAEGTDGFGYVVLRNNLLFEAWRQRTPEEVAILYKTAHPYGASKRVQVRLLVALSYVFGHGLTLSLPMLLLPPGGDQ
jgi:hypothetical protein